MSQPVPQIVSQAEIEAVARAVGERLGSTTQAAAPTEQPDLVRHVVREVLAALASEGPAPSETAPEPTMESPSETAELTTPRGAKLLPIQGTLPSPEHCRACVEQEKARQRSRAVLTTTGRNQRGIVARLTARIAELGGDIVDISQTLVGDYFTMILVVDVGALDVSYEQFQTEVVEAVRGLGCHAMMMHEDVMVSLHRV